MNCIATLLPIVNKISTSSWKDEWVSLDSVNWAALDNERDAVKFDIHWENYKHRMWHHWTDVIKEQSKKTWRIFILPEGEELKWGNCDEIVELRRHKRPTLRAKNDAKLATDWHGKPYTYIIKLIDNC